MFHFAEEPAQYGRDTFRRFFTARLSLQRGYCLKKTLMASEGNVLTNLWEGTWEGTSTGKAMAGRRLEVWRMRHGMLGVWDAAFNVWEQGGERGSPIM